ncbi:hypothetical protein PMI01_03374 [Caulobacter sp. AP07]|uniref:DUF4180 domain-containing protein n=1 Tax=Caulobacter sp. AP07 TaxID=1144304 RepID=UPI000272206B|nr:DUF4180 domain-containing protein [Caulobacter sp. AP07]EJL29213.1 hypothetical protein PMI01_03374 [Caulobacter sp. AP07]
MDQLEILQGAPVLVCDAQGPPLDSDRAASDFLSAAWSDDAHWLAIPLERLGPGFLDLSTRLAGEVIQKFTNYRMAVAFIGDITPWTEASQSLAAFVAESNRGATVWFVPDLSAFEARLAKVALPAA